MILIFSWLAGVKNMTGESSEISIVDSDRIVIEKILKVLREKTENRRIGEIMLDELNTYFEIKNEKGESFVEAIGIENINGDFAEIKTLMLSDGFDENDYQKFVEARMKAQEGEYIKKIINNLNNFCPYERWDSYLMEVPQGVITRDGIKLKEAIGNEIFLDSKNLLEIYTPVSKFKIYHRGIPFEIKYRQLKMCNEK
jgi:hypothetical protein